MCREIRLKLIKKNKKNKTKQKQNKTKDNDIDPQNAASAESTRFTKKLPSFHNQ